MSEDEVRRFWCMIDDEQTVFYVNASLRWNVEELKDAIQQRRPRLQTIDIVDLVLWKLNDPIPVDDDDDSLPQLLSKPISVKLGKRTQKLSDAFPSLPEDHLHIIVKLPDQALERPAKRVKLEYEANEPLVGTFIDLRTHLWGCNRFNTVSAAGNSYTTVDLTQFNLPQLNPRSTKILLLRDEYKLAYIAIRQVARTRRCIFLITGHPGIGKTLFLLCLLIILLQERVPVALQIDANDFILFDNCTARKYKTNSIYASVIPEGAWTLSDSSGEGQIEPCAAFKHSKAHIVHTSSPASSRWKEWVKQLGATRYIMDVWSSEELQVLLTISGLNIQRGVDLFRKYGSNVRSIVEIIQTPTAEQQYLTDVRSGASNFANDFPEAFSNLQNLDLGSKASSKIFTVRPHKISREPVLRIPTPFLATILGLALAGLAVARQHAAFTMLSKHSSLRTATGWLFENFAHAVLSDPNRAPLATYIRNQIEAPSIPPPNNVISGSTALKNIQPPFSFYWRPRETNFEGLDAIIRDKNTVWGLQYTIRAKHGSVLEGLIQIRKEMNHKRGVKYRLAMLGPEQADAESARDNQKLTGEWAKTPISACVLPLGTVNEALLRKVLDEASDSYPEDQSSDLDLLMYDESN